MYSLQNSSKYSLLGFSGATSASASVFGLLLKPEEASTISLLSRGCSLWTATSSAICDYSCDVRPVISSESEARTKVA